jgi:hypothetical protein
VLSGGVLSTVVMPDTEEVTDSIPVSPTRSKWPLTCGNASRGPSFCGSKVGTGGHCVTNCVTTERRLVRHPATGRIQAMNDSSCIRWSRWWSNAHHPSAAVARTWKIAWSTSPVVTHEVDSPPDGRSQPVREAMSPSCCRSSVSASSGRRAPSATRNARGGTSSSTETCAGQHNYYYYSGGCFCASLGPSHWCG